MGDLELATMDRLPNDTKETELTPEFVGKSDKDIQTIASLSALASQMGGKLVLSGGYATEALCGGRITRPHGDIDARFIFEEAVENDPVFQKVEVILKTEETTWRTRKKGQGKADYLEEDETKNYNTKRELEVYIPIPWTYNVSFEEAILIDSHGGEVAVNVIGYNDLVAHKIEKLYEVRNGIDATKDRDSSETDNIDMRRLISLDRFNKGRIFSKLVKKYRSGEKVQEMWNYVVSLGFDLNRQ